MFWADSLAKEIEEKLGTQKPILIRDEKTVSGRVHVGSMRGVVIHSVVAQALQSRGVENKFLYEFNDFDPMDDIPSYLPREKFEPYLGKPLRDIPSPDTSASSFAEFFANDFRSVITDTGFMPEYYWSSDLYFAGKMDSAIREALEGAESIRRIYKEVSGSERQDNWLPLNVLCPTCGKLSTTKATDFDGETVMVNCYPSAVEWTVGCGFEGRVSPFGGKAKLPWKAEWPAKWKVVGVDVEGGGKDHSTRGGSRDVANRISKEVFHYEPPFDIPYEFILIGGKKMSSSKGRGSSAREIADLVPAKIFRLAILSKDFNQAVNFDPEGDTIPVLYDLYDKLAEGYTSGVEDDYARLFELSHVAPPPRDSIPAFLLRFSQVAFITQMPHLDVFVEAAALNGSALTQSEKDELAERVVYAKKWLELCAPEKFIFTLQETLPEVARAMSPVQKKALKALAAFISGYVGMPSGEELHATLHGLKDSEPIAPGELFSAIYLAFLGKPQGPKAGWFLSVLEKDFVLKRLEEAAA